MKTVNIYMGSRFNLERSILKESLGDGYVARTCAAQAPTSCSRYIRDRISCWG